MNKMPCTLKRHILKGYEKLLTHWFSNLQKTRKAAKHTVGSDLAFACPHSTHDDSRTTSKTENRLRFRASPMGLAPGSNRPTSYARSLFRGLCSRKCVKLFHQIVILNCCKGTPKAMHKEDDCQVHSCT